MKSVVKKKTASKRVLRLAAVVTALVLLITGAVIGFTGAYSSYTDEILYAERLGQMRNVTDQLFTGLEDVINNQWYIAKAQLARLEADRPYTTDALTVFMKQQERIGQFDTLNTSLLAVDNRGRFYTKDGRQGLFMQMSYLEENPERLSFVDNSVTQDRTSMIFLYRLENPITFMDGDTAVKLTYYGMYREMTELDQYFNCDVYDEQSSVYVLDPYGIKMFSGTNNSSTLQGMNAYNVLRNMSYLHDVTFDSVLESLQTNGNAYSNAILDGEEMYYALYQMKNAAWTLLFLVPSRFVATNTVQLVESTTKLVLAFATILMFVCIGVIYLILRQQQKRELFAAEQNNQKLEAVNQKLDEKNRMLESANHELEIAKEEANDARKLAESASQAKTEFLSNMSHDIRTPMNAIVGITSLMEHEEEDPEKLDAYIQKVQTSSKHLLSLINDVLDMSKIESSGVILNTEPVNLSEQIEQIETIIRPQTDDRKQNFVIRTHQIAHEHLIGDSVRLRQIVINLLSNAVKYTQEGGQITLDLSEFPTENTDKASFGIIVEDNGYGMTEQFVKHIFEPFTRAENSTTNKVQGTGLGMAITKNIVDLMNGTITVQSELGKGSSFEVRLTLPINQNVEYTTKLKSVLLLTKDEELIQNIQVAMKTTEVAFESAKGVEQAIALVKTRQPEILLLSGYLEHPNLQDIVKRLRQAAGADLLIFCCDYAQTEHVNEMLLENDIDGLVPCPFFYSNLLRAVDKVSGGDLETSQESILKGMRFLCAEDNNLNAEILSAIMDMNGASCVIYPDGCEIVKAFESVKPGEFDAILMDVQMPKMNGLEATKAIRHSANPLGKTIPIIAMTANAFSSDVQNCLNAGMDAHVAKPLDIAVLERTLKSVANAKIRGGRRFLTSKNSKIE